MYFCNQQCTEKSFLVFPHGKLFAFFVRCLVLNPSTKYLKQLRIIFLPNSNPTQTLSHYLRIVLVYAAWMFLSTTSVTNKSTVYRNHKQFVKRPTKTYYCEIFLLLLDPLLPGFTVPLTEKWINGKSKCYWIGTHWTTKLIERHNYVM